MLTYDDCVSLCELTPEEIAAIARHEHLPEIIALEMGWSLCLTPKGRQMIRRMIESDIEEARGRGAAKAAAALEQVLHRFPAAHEPPGDDRDRPIRALGVDAAAAPWVRQRVDAYLTAMLRRLGLEREEVRQRFRLELLTAEACCAACTETGRCRRFLAGAAGSDASPSAFCPNAQLLAGLRCHRDAA